MAVPTFSELASALTAARETKNERRLARLLLNIGGGATANQKKATPIWGKKKASGISTGVLDFVAVSPADATIYGWWIRHDATSVTLKFIKAASAEPVLGDSINTSGLTVATGLNISTTLTDFTTTAITALDVLNAYITSITGTLTSVECGLLISKT